MMSIETKIKKFNSRYTMDLITGCWNWIAAKDGDGYGIVSHMNRTIHASKLSYILFCGEVPAGMLVCHTCDNPGCVNPAHLWLGTNKDNQQDMVRKGRASYKNQYSIGGKYEGPKAKLTFGEALNIKKLSKFFSTKRIAKAYGFSYSYTYDVIKRSYLGAAL